jgi:TRAP-type transport system periplasmic protein
LDSKNRRTRYIFLTLCMVLLVTALLVSGCQSSNTTDQTKTVTSTVTQTVTSTAAATTESKTYDLKWATENAPTGDDAKTTEILGKLIEQYTGGKVKITYYHANTLGKTADFINMLNNGICDIVRLTPTQYPNVFDMMPGKELPLLGVPNRTAASEVGWELYYAGYYDQDFADLKLLAIQGGVPMNFYLTKKVTKIEDFKGLRIRCPSPDVGKLVELSGGTLVTMTGPEVYQAMERGVIDGAYTASNFAYDSKWYEVCDYALWTPISASAPLQVMNKKIWDSMSPDIQLGIEKAINAFKYEHLRYFQPGDSKVVSNFESKGMEVYSLSADEVTKWQAKAAPIINDWIAAREAKGKPAQKMMDLVNQIVDRY